MNNIQAFVVYRNWFMNMNNGWILQLGGFQTVQTSPSLDLTCLVPFLLLIVHSVIIEESEFERLLHFFLKMMGKYISSSNCQSNCKINHISYYCYLLSFYIRKTEQPYKVNAANILQCRLSFSWQFISWKLEEENKQPTSPRKDHPQVPDMCQKLLVCAFQKWPLTLLLPAHLWGSRWCALRAEQSSRTDGPIWRWGMLF